MNLNVVRKLTVQYASSGADQVTSEAKKVSDAHQRVADTANTAAQVTETGSKRQLSAASAYDRLRRSIDDQYRAQQQLERGQQTVQRAFAQDKIDLDEKNRMLALLSQRFAANDNAASRFSKTMGLAGHQMRNLGFQANDVLSGWMMGQSPFTIMTQQGGQVIQVLQSAEGGLKGLASRVVAAIGPWGLLAAGIAAAGAAAVVFYRMATADTKTLEQSLEEHARLLAVVKERYDEAADAAKGLSIQTQNVTVLQALQTEFELRQKLAEQVKHFASGAAARIVGPGIDASTAIPLPEDVGASYRGFIVILRELQDTVNRGATPDFVKFREEVAKLGRDGSQDVRKLAVEWIKLAEQPADIQQSIERLQAMVKVVEGLGDAASRAALGMKSLTVEDPIKAFNDSYTKILNIAPKANEELLKGIKLRELEITSNKALSDLNKADISSTDFSIRQKELLNGVSRARIAIMHGEKQAVQQGASAYETLMQRTKDRIQELQLEAQHASKTADEVIALKVAHDLERAAKSSNVTITQEMRQEWARLGAETAAAQRLTREIKQWNQLTENFTNTLVQGLVEGKSLMDALVAAAGQLGQAMMQVGTKQISQSLVSGAQSAIPALGGAGGNLAVGGLGVLISLWSANEQKKKQELEKQQQAWQAWKDTAFELKAYFAKAGGTSVGSLESEAESFTSESNRLIRLRAEAIGDAAGGWDAEIQRIIDARDQFIARLKKEFADGFEKQLSAFSSGRGPGDAFSQAAEGVRKMGEQLHSFVADAAFVFGDSSRQVQQAKDASRAYALTLLDTKEELTDVGLAVAEMNGKASVLDDVLISLGMSASEAAMAIDQRLSEALGKLRSSFEEDIQRQINSASGKEFVNSFLDLFKSDSNRRADAQLLGVGTGGLDTLFGLSAQNIVDDAQLAGAEFSALIEQFPQLSGVVHEFVNVADDVSDAVVRSLDDIAQAIQSYEDRLFAATNNASTLTGALAAFDRKAEQERQAEIALGGQALVALEAALQAERLNIVLDFQQRELQAQQQAYQEQLDAAQRAADEQKRIAQQQREFLIAQGRKIKEYLDSLKSNVDAGVSPEQAYNNAKAAYDAQFALTSSSNVDIKNAALETITTYAEAYREASQNFFGSTSGYQTVLNEINTELGGLPAVTSGFDRIVTALTGTSGSVRSALVGSGTNNLLSVLSNIDLNADGIITQAEMEAALTNKNVANVATHTSGIPGIATNTNSLPGIGTNTNSLPGIGVNTNSLPGIAANSDELPGIDAGIADSNTILNAIESLQNTATSHLNLMQNQLTNAGQGNITVTPGSSLIGSSFNVSNNMLTALNKIVFNTWATARNTGFHVNVANSSIQGQFGSLAGGGWVHGPGTNTSDSIFAGNAWVSNGEYVVNARAANALRPIMDTYINRGVLPANDNRAIEAKLDKLIFAVLRSAAASAEYTGGEVRNVAKAIREGNRGKLLAA